jgi:putative salt-induced outer membrane protein YdiY
MAQNDTLITTTGERFFGTVDRLSESRLTFDSKSGEEDYIIDWKKVAQLNTYHLLRVVSRTKEVHEGYLRDDNPNDSLVTFLIGEIPVVIAYEDILALSKIEDRFIDKLDLGVNLGYSFTKATNTTQLSIRSSAGYDSERWSFDANYNEFLTIIDTIQTNRLDASATSRYLLKNYWFTSTSANWFSSDEQEISLRTTILVGGGKYILYDQVKTLQLGLGIAWNNENFTTENAVVRESYELYLGTRYHLFDHKFFTIKTNMVGYASLTEDDRYRASVNLDFGWDIGDDFDLIWGYGLNFDSNPPNNAQQTDYVVSLTVGWEL